MAGTKIRGITIQLGADTTQLTDAFKKATSELKATQKSLNDVNKLLKLDPKNVELLTQKSGYLTKAIEQANAQLDAERDMLAKLGEQDQTPEVAEQQNALKRQIEATQAQISQYNKELQDTSNALNGVETETKDVGEATKDAGKDASTFGDMLKAKLAGDAIVGGIKALGQALMQVGKELVNIAKNSSAYADNIMVLATQTGLSTDALQEYSYMAELVDTDVSTITSSLAKLTRNMASAQDGSRKQTEAFNALGVSVTDANGDLRDSNQVFDEVIRALGQVENETERNALAMDIFGKSAMELNPLIAVGAEGLDQYRQEAQDMGAVLDGEALNALGNVDDAFQRLNQVGTILTNQIGTAMAPIVEELAGLLVDLAKSVDWQAVGNTIGKALKFVISVFESVITVATKVYNAVKPIVETIVNWFANLKFEWPKLKLPHFSISPKGWKIGDLLKGSIPRLAIDWYAKGMEGMILKQPTIFGMNNQGQLMGGGEVGNEIIVGQNNLMRMIKNAVGQQGITVNMTINAGANMNAEQLAQYTIDKLNAQINAQRKVWA